MLYEFVAGLVKVRCLFLLRELRLLAGRELKERPFWCSGRTEREPAA